MLITIIYLISILLQTHFTHSSQHIFMEDYYGSAGKESTCNAGDLGSIHGSGRSCGGGNGYPLQYSCLDNPMVRGAWQGYSPWGCKESETAEATKTFTHMSEPERESPALMMILFWGQSRVKVKVTQRVRLFATPWTI